MDPEQQTIICNNMYRQHVHPLANDDWKDAQDWMRKIKELSHILETTVTILWIPSHCGCEGNEEADRLAEEGTKLEQSEVPITFAIAKARVNKRS